MPHLILLGDSIFDNGSYVQKGLDVTSQLRPYLPQDWRSTLLAIDGSTSLEINRQVEKIPADASHLILSTGGNDAIQELSFLEEPSRTNSDAILRLSDLTAEFRQSYQRAIRLLSGPGLPLALCTIYHPVFPDPAFQKISETVLAVFNDVILGEAIQTGRPVLDLRRVCREEMDFSNTIEPSEIGGRKIAMAISRLFKSHAFGSRKTEIFT